MKTSFIIVSLLVGAISATPIAVKIRQSTRVSITENEYTQGGCKPIILFFARGSTEIGNMGSTVGPPTGEGLKKAFGANNVAVEGIDYQAGIGTNLLPGGAELAGIQEMKALFQDAAAKCPTSALVGVGYSQGAALCHRAIEDLPATVKSQIAGVVTYGDTQNTQDRGQIPNFAKDKTLVICNPGDAVCTGVLTILPAHLDYVKRVPEAVAFLTTKIKAAQ
ncbi:related to cutinase 1 precursor [Rhynchosporium agropyri]|uniref:cutinase n=1 Tax=Rhynchosporium agropyri TaxID=914238 RepID=A0A1E1L996_9HELO|nr:related to cutinase 1 precursor [Rhynchosporium agropyri]